MIRFMLMACLAGGFGLSSLAQTKGVVASASPEATAAGIEILEAGGNAIDAAVAVQFALGVTEPAMSGLGGQTQIILKRPGEPPVVINGTSFAPGQLPDEVNPGDLVRGWRASTVPSTVRVMDFAWRQYGSGEMAWARLLAPAIRYAEDGYVVGSFRAKVYARHAPEIATEAGAARFVLKPDGTVPERGDVMRQPVLAATLRRLAVAGASDFYTGDIARQIAADMAANGGWITAEDLARTPEPVVMAPLMTRYRDAEVYTLPPPAGGWVALFALGMLDEIPADQLAEENVRRAEVLLEALARAHRARRDMPEADLVAYEDDMAVRLSDEMSRALVSDFVPPGGETTHFSIIDSDGMVVSVTASIDSYFGSKVASPTLGFFYNNYMQSFDLEPGRPFSLRPRAMAYSSMSSTLVTRGGEPVLVLGSPGSERIISSVVQIVSHWLDIGAGIERAVAAPRVHVAVDSTDGRDNAYLETPVEGLDLERLGLDGVAASDTYVQNGLNAYFGGVHAVALDESGWTGAADPRRDGTVGYVNDR